MSLNAGKSNDTSCDRQGVEEEQLEPLLATEDEDESIASVLRKLIPDEVKGQAVSALVTIPSMVEEAV